MKIRFVVWLGFILACHNGCRSVVMERKGPEVPLEKIRAMEAPFEMGMEILASRMNVVLSRNYIQDPTLATPGGGGQFHKIKKRKYGKLWKVVRGPAFIPLKFRFRELKATVIDVLSIDFPPINTFKAELVAHGHVVVDIKGKGVYKGEELLIKDGKVMLDGRTILVPASPQR